MTHYYWDTSAIAKHYYPEIGTPKVDAILAEPDAIHFISRLGTVELRSVFAKRVRMGSLSTSDFHLVCRQVFTDVANGVYQVIPILTHSFREAERLLTTHATVSSLRTLDAIQLAVARDVQQQGKLDYFICADATLCNVATVEGLAVINPENP